MSGKNVIAPAPRFADTDGSRLIMAFIAGWLAVVVALAFSFETATQISSDMSLERLAHTALGYALSAGVTLWLCKLALRRIWSLRLGYVLVAAMALAGIGIAVNLGGYCTFPGTWDNPALGNGTDTAREWKWIAYHCATGEYIGFSNKGYTWLASLFADRLGPGIAGVLLLNIAMLGGTLAASARIAATLVESRDKRRTAFAAALITASVASMIWYSTIPLKEMTVTFGFTLFSVGLAKLYRQNLDASGILASAGGSYLLMLSKGPMGWFLMAGVCLACTRYCRLWPQKYVRLYSRGICLLLFCAAIIIGGKQFRVVPDLEALGEIDEKSDGMERSMKNYPTVERYATLIPNYFNGTREARLAKLPLTAPAQYFPPFPWNFTRDTELGRFVWYAHISIFWYLLGGAALGYAVLCIWRRRTRGHLGRWTLWWAVCYLGVAYFSGGTVARYYLPMIPCLTPLALQFARCVRSGSVARRSAVIYSCVYIVLMAAGLTAAYIFLKC